MIDLRSDTVTRPTSEMRRVIETRHRLEPLTESGGDPGVAKEFRVAGFRGTIGFIMPMSDHFCAACRRLRLTADGVLKTCLFEPPACGLRDAMRGGCSDHELEALVRNSLLGKPLTGVSRAALPERQTCSMAQIGG